MDLTPVQIQNLRDEQGMDEEQIQRMIDLFSKMTITYTPSDTLTVTSEFIGE
jgi:hypothetical protein